MKIFAMILICILLAGCKADTVNIGVVGDFDGPGNVFAQSGYVGAELAISELGLESIYELTPIDIDQIIESSSMEDVQMDFYIGPFLSSELEKIYPIFSENDVLGFIPSATLNVLEGNDDYIYRLINTTDDQIIQFSQLLSDHNYESVLLLYDVNNQGYSKALTQGILESGKVPRTRMYEVDDAYVNQVKRWSVPEYDAVVIVASGKKSAELVQYLRKEAQEVPIYLSAWSHNPDTIKYIGDKTDQLYIYTNGYAEDEYIYDNFSVKLQETYGQSTSTASQYAYEGIFFFDYLQKHVGSFNKEKIRVFLNENPDFQGPFFFHHLDEYGQGTHKMQLLRIEDGVFIHAQE